MNFKKIRRVWLVLASLISAVVLTRAVLPTSLAYMQETSNTVHNTLNVTYTPPEDISVPVRVHKTIVSTGEETISPEGFSFALRNAENGEVILLTTNEHGYASASLPFSAADVGKTFTYELTEIKGDNEHVTYSEQVYTIRITLSVDMFNCINADVTVNDIHVIGVVAEFENVYEPVVIPDTGDDCPVMLLALMMVLSAAGLVLLGKARRRSALN